MHINALIFTLLGLKKVFAQRCVCSKVCAQVVSRILGENSTTNALQVNKNGRPNQCGANFIASVSFIFKISAKKIPKYIQSPKVFKKLGIDYPRLKASCCFVLKEKNCRIIYKKLVMVSPTRGLFYSF